MAKKPRVDLVPVASVNGDCGTQVRVEGLDPRRIALFVGMLKESEKEAKTGAVKGKHWIDFAECPFEDLPRVVHDKALDEYYGIDLHRRAAYKEAGWSKMHVEIYEGNLEFARWLAASSNKENLGMPRTQKDVAYACRQAIQSPLSTTMTDEEIAKHVGVHRNTIVNHRRELKEAQNGTAPKAPKAKAGNPETDSQPTAEEIAANTGEPIQTAPEMALNNRHPHDGESDQPQAPVESPIASPAPAEAAKPVGKSSAESQLLAAIVAAWPNATRTSDGRVYFKRAQVEIIDPLIKELMP